MRPYSLLFLLLPLGLKAQIPDNLLKIDATVKAIDKKFNAGMLVDKTYEGTDTSVFNHTAYTDKGKLVCIYAEKSIGDLPVEFMYYFSGNQLIYLSRKVLDFQVTNANGSPRTVEKAEFYFIQKKLTKYKVNNEDWTNRKESVDKYELEYSSKSEKLVKAFGF